MPPGWMYAAGEKQCLCRRSMTEYAHAGGHIQRSLGMTQLCKQDQPHDVNAFWRWLLGKMGQILPYSMQEVSPQRFYSTNLPTFKFSEYFSTISTHVTQLLILSFTLFFPPFFLLALSQSFNLFWRLGTEFFIYVLHKSLACYLRLRLFSHLWKAARDTKKPLHIVTILLLVKHYQLNFHAQTSC